VCHRVRLARAPAFLRRWVGRPGDCPPEQVRVELPGALQMAQLLEARERPRLVLRGAEIDPIEQALQLARAVLRRPAAG
jgi:hypothetical protein